MRKTSRIALVVSALVVGGSLMGASAPEPPTALKDQRQYPAESSLTTSGGAGQSGGISTQALSSGIAPGCSGTVQYPHKSQSFVSVHAQTTCASAYDMFVGVNLQRGRWWGWENMANGNRAGVRAKVDGFAKWYCGGAGTYDYMAGASHRVTINGTSYTGFTESDIKRLSC